MNASAADTAPPPLPPPESVLTLQPPLIPSIPDAIVLVLLPIAVYWLLSLFFHFIDTHGFLSSYRIHTPEEVLKRNHVSRREVVRDVLVQQFIQSLVGLAISFTEAPELVGAEWWEVMNLYSGFVSTERWVLRGIANTLRIDGIGLEEKIIAGITATGGDKVLAGLVRLLGLDGKAGASPEMTDWRYKLVEVAYWYLLPAARLWVAFFLLDTWQYFLHRLMHEVKWLYRTFHSRHHRLYVPYAFGALYNHPVEGFLMDTIGAGMAYKLSGLRIRGAMFFFSFSTMKTVDDHCGYALPFDPLQFFFWNNAKYHDIHHQGWGIKTNYSQPFFICWDRWLGTQWTGGDVASRYAASRERAAEMCAQDRMSNEKEDITNSTNSPDTASHVSGNLGNGLKQRISDRKPKVHAGGSGGQTLDEGREGSGAESRKLRNNQRVNGRAR